MSLELSDIVLTTVPDASATVDAAKKPRAAPKCGVCRLEGHTKSTCSANADLAVGGAGAGAGAASESTTTPAEAEASATEWLGPSPSIVRTWFVQAVLDPRQHRDIGKFLAQPAEVLVNQWVAEKTGRPIRSVVGMPYDGETSDAAKRVRHQVKFRMGDWHFETTRRNSAKNAETNGTGHVAYRNDEFDMVAIFKPGPHFGVSGFTVRCIPTAALINPDKPDQLVTTIKAAVRKEYDIDKKTEEVLRAMYSAP